MTLDYIEHFITQATRNNHTLDLVFAMHPDLINDVNVVPGISDHMKQSPSKLNFLQVFHLQNIFIIIGLTPTESQKK